jgi:flagellar hook-associated protein 1 FlgK
MGGLLDALNAGRSTIFMAKSGIQVTGHNIANANTEGFHRRELLTSPAVSPASVITASRVLGGGVVVDGVVRSYDALLANQVVSATGEDAMASTRQTYLLQVEQAVASFGDDGLGAGISDLMNAFSALATSPSDLSVRGEVINAAETLAYRFRQMAGVMDRVMDGAHEEVEAHIGSANNLLAEVADLNSEILHAEAGGQEASDLRDRRGNIITDLARMIGVSAFEDPTGQMTVVLDGHTLVDENRHATIQATQQTDGRTQILISHGGGPTVNLTSRVSGGEIGGILSVQDTIVQEIMPRVDALAYDLATEINAQHRNGFDLGGAAGGDIFSVVAAPGSAASLSVVAGLAEEDLAASSTAAGVPGNNENALALADLARQDLAGGGTVTFVEEAAGVVASVGSMTSQAIRSASLQSEELTYLKNMQQSSDGVSLDEEMVALVQFQRSYQAGVKVLQVVDELLQQVMNIV